MCRVAQISLGVKGVVQLPFSNRGACNSGMKMLWCSKHCKCCQVTTKTPTSNCYACCVGARGNFVQVRKYIDLITQHGGCEVVIHLALPFASSPRCATSIGNDNTKTLVGKPLSSRERHAARHHALCVWATVRVEQYGKRGTVMIFRQHNCSADISFANAVK